MPASIAPTSTGAATYIISSSNRAQVDLKLDFSLGSTNDFTLTYATASPGVQVTLIKGLTSLDLLPGPVTDGSTFSGRLVDASTAASGPNTVLSISLGASSTEATAEPWILRIQATSAVNWTFNYPANAGAGFISRIMCDPVAQISSVVSPSPKEKDNVNMTAAMGIVTGTIVGAPTPLVYYKWDYTTADNIVVSGFPMSGLSQTGLFTAPGVYGTKNITLTLDVWFEGTDTTPGFLTAHGEQPLTITPRTQHLLLVLDRSGSMSGQRWDNAVIAAKMLAQMYLSLRKGVKSADRVGIMVFEDSTCTWRAFYSPDSLINLAMPLSTTDTDLNSICSVPLGAPGSCTPIGDALIEGMRRLAPLYSASDPPKFHVVLLTDGYENSGSVYLKETSSATAAGAQNFALKRGSTVNGVDLSPVNTNVALYPIGLGATVDDEVLNQLAWANTGAPTPYRNVVAPKDLKSAFAQMVGYSQEAQEVVSADTTAGLQALLVGVTVPPDSTSPARFLAVEPKANRLLIALQWAAGSHTVELAKAEAGGSYVPVTAPLAACDKHGFVAVDIAQIYGGEANVPQTFWRVVHKVGGTATAIATDDFFAYVDLNVKMDIVFNQREYRTGDPMRITARLREGHLPIKGARVQVELARPGQSLGTFLATNSQGYRPGTGGRGLSDVPPPKEDMLRALMRGKEIDTLGTTAPPGLFPDGTSLLQDDGAHDDRLANDGDYANTYTKVDMEGVYTWRVFASGRLANGAAFTRVMVVTTWAGIRVDPGMSPISFTFGLPAPLGYQAVQVSLVPKSAGGQYLGPFRDDTVKFTTTVGTFQGSVTFDYDGTYKQVLQYPDGSDPKIGVVIGGVPFPPTPVKKPHHEGALCRFFRWLARLFCCED